MRKHLKLIVLLLTVSAASACSFEGASSSGGALTIVLDEKPETQLLFDNFMLANPTSASDFNCFAVNVTGPGISPESQKLQNCTSPNNFGGHGVGIVTEPRFRGQSFQIDVPAGQSRFIDVYGIFPTPSDCIGNPNPSSGGSGSGGGYLLGSVLKNIVASMTVSVPISYSGGNVDVSCAGGGGQFFVNGSSFPYRAASSVNGFNMSITGSGFLSTATVTIGSTNCPVSSVTNNEIICVFPSMGAGTYTIHVDNGNGQSADLSNAFAVVAPGTTELSFGFNTGNVDFGASPVGTPRVVRLRFANMGTLSSGSPSASYPNPDFTPTTFPGGAECANAPLSSGTICYVDVTFTPSATGSRGGGATIFGNGMTFVATGT